MPNKTILFADDSATMRAIMQKTFASEPFDVVVVSSGDAAIQKAKEVSPALIIADAGMVGVTGYDICEAVRADGGLSTTPVVIMAGVSTPYDEARGSAVGATEYVKKPFDTAQLIEKVAELSVGGAPAPAAVAAPAAKPVPAARPAPAAKSAPVAKPAAAAPAGRPAARAAAPGRPPIPPPRAGKTEQVPGATPGAAAKQAAAASPEPDTREFGRPGGAGAAAAAPPLPQDPSSQQFQVSTLAELAQMDNAGKQQKPEAAKEAAPVPKVAPVAQEAIETKASAGGAQVAASVEGLTPDQADAIRKLTTEVIEQVVWEVVPELAETIIREELAKLLEE